MFLIGWLVGFYGLSTQLDNLLPNPVYIYVLNIYVILVGWMGFMAYQPLLVIRDQIMFVRLSLPLYKYICVEYIWFVNE